MLKNESKTGGDKWVWFPAIQLSCRERRSMRKKTNQKPRDKDSLRSHKIASNLSYLACYKWNESRPCLSPCKENNELCPDINIFYSLFPKQLHLTISSFHSFTYQLLCIIYLSFSVLQMHTNRNTTTPHCLLRTYSWKAKHLAVQHTTKQFSPYRINAIDEYTDFKNANRGWMYDTENEQQKQMVWKIDRPISRKRCWLVEISHTSAMKLNTGPVSHFSILHLQLTWLLLFHLRKIKEMKM